MHIMEFIGNKKPQVDSDNSHAFVLSGISTNKEELVKGNGYDAID